MIENKDKFEVKKWKLSYEKWGESEISFFVKEDKKFYYGILSLPPKKNAPVDEGHPNGEYVFCSEGRCKLVLHLKSGKKYINLEKGNTILIPKNIVHEIHNDNNEQVKLNFVIYL